MRTSTFDRAGIAISSLCIIHCLFLPMVITILPLAGVLAENEYLHKILVILAVVPALIAFAPPLRSKIGLVIRGSGCLGVLCLLLGAFVEPFHDYEKQLTVIGALSLASAHLSRLLTDKHHGHQN